MLLPGANIDFGLFDINWNVFCGSSIFLLKIFLSKWLPLFYYSFMASATARIVLAYVVLWL